MTKKILLFAMLLALFACSGKEVKQQSPESKSATEAFALAEAIRSAFTKNDLPALRNYSTAEGFKEITVNRRPFDSVELTFTPRWVELEGNQLTLNVAWKSKWIASGKAAEDRGMAVFLMEGRPMKLAKILRANPFAYPEK